MVKRKRRVRHYSRRSGVHVGSYVRGVKITDPRRKRAKAQDRRQRAKKVYPLTKAGVKAWKKHRNTTDLIGIDVLIRRVHKVRRHYRRKIYHKAIRTRRLHQVRGRFRTLKRRTGLTGVEEHALIQIAERAVGRGNVDKVDLNSLVDGSLSYRENRRIIEAAVSPSFKDAHYMGYI